jgi:hypothetical protein
MKVVVSTNHPNEALALSLNSNVRAKGRYFDDWPIFDKLPQGKRWLVALSLIKKKDELI